MTEEAEREERKILIAEDDEALRSMLQSSLEMRDFTVVAADCRESALAQLKNNPDIQVMLIDLGLPPAAHNTDEGIALIKNIVASNSSAKIIVLTGQDEESAALAAIREGAFDFLAKPASLEKILQSLGRAFLFVRQEINMSADGLTRLQINARIADGLKAVREDAEEKLVRQVLKDTEFNVYQSAARLGIKRESVYYFLKKFGIQRDTE
ncbi:response regulator transcription factor [Pseudohongiella spirulinae]|uniref:Fis family transcriptional regulator n=1 Tax=Pseudohongiella spirulinae TaxID=1249552 RepID=A0A0S2KAM0_9GAMM|nr:response regulator [Pseudohongiella spirulinae]ALO45367.1 Fis family transcriptional regulator [Pseudohongiella spirulinae]